MAHRFKQVFLLVIDSFIHDLAKTPFLDSVVWALRQQILESVQVFPERLLRNLVELVNSTPDFCGLVSWVEFLEKQLNKFLPRLDRIGL